MALSHVKEILLKAATDAEFREDFFKHTDEVLSRYELTDEEKQCLREKASEEALEQAVKVIQTKPVACASDIRL